MCVLYVCVCLYFSVLCAVKGTCHGLRLSILFLIPRYILLPILYHVLVLLCLLIPISNSISHCQVQGGFFLQQFTSDKLPLPCTLYEYELKEALETE